MYGYIYMIVNKVNGKTYIGKHKLYKKAWNEDNYMGSGILLGRAKNKYGIENFEKFLITYTYSKEDACKKEKFWIAEYRSRGKAEYNIADGGDGGSGPCSEETKKKISDANKGKTKGRHLSEEIKKKISEAKKGKPNGNKGKPKSLEHKRKIGEAHKGIHYSEEARKKISEAKKGKHISEEVLKRRSETVKGKHWYNNGTKNIWSKTCPKGFVPGRINYVRSSTLCE